MIITSTHIFTVYLILFVLEFVVSWMLSVFNMNSSLLNRKAIPSFTGSVISEDEYKKSIDYTVKKANFSLISKLINGLLILVIILFKIPAKLDNWMMNFSLSEPFHGVLFILIFGFFIELLSLPEKLYHHFVIEEEFGFNKLTPKLFFVDLAKSLMLTLIIAVPLMFAVFVLIEKTGGNSSDRWWLWSFGIIIFFQFAIQMLYPILIAPLFNKFTVLEDHGLKKRILKLTDSCGFKFSDVYLMDGSKRSGHSNAYFAGIGKTRRIVLYDTLLEQMTHDQILAVVAHEIGHFKNRDIIRGYLISAITTFLFFFIVQLIMDFQPLYMAFGFGRSSYYAIFVILALFSSPLTFFLIPVFTHHSRKREFLADKFAAKKTDPKWMEKALLVLAKENLSLLTPHPAFSFFYYSHPPVGERIAAILKKEEDDKK